MCVFLLHTHTHTQLPSCGAPDKLLSEQMTKNKNVPSSQPASPKLFVMVRINHAKPPSTQSSLSFSLPLLRPPVPMEWCLLADGFLMAKLWHSADGSLHLLQPAMQLMAAIMTKAPWGCCAGNQWRMRQQGVNVVDCGIFLVYCD